MCLWVPQLPGRQGLISTPFSANKQCRVEQELRGVSSEAGASLTAFHSHLRLASLRLHENLSQPFCFLNLQTHTSVFPICHFSGSAAPCSTSVLPSCTMASNVLLWEKPKLPVSCSCNMNQASMFVRQTLHSIKGHILSLTSGGGLGNNPTSSVKIEGKVSYHIRLPSHTFKQCDLMGMGASPVSVGVRSRW